MLAMAVDIATRRLVAVQRPVPSAAAGEVLVRVRACGVCRTDLHILDAELPPHREHVVPGHEIVGEVVALGDGARQELRRRPASQNIGVDGRRRRRNGGVLLQVPPGHDGHPRHFALMARPGRGDYPCGLARFSLEESAEWTGPARRVLTI